jgi:aryl-alcohol dehydrogenase-like predicted oxidoreductase
MNPNDISRGAWTVDQLDPDHPRVKSWIDTIEYAICDAGISVLDTAPWYGHGISEIVVGWALEKILNKPNGKVKREQLTINTKVGRYEADPGQQFDFSAEATVHSVERSIRRLCCGSYIDVLQLHDPEFAPSIDLLFEETIPAMIECQVKGWCRALGMTGEYCNISLIDQTLRFSISIATCIDRLSFTCSASNFGTFVRTIRKKYLGSISRL